MTVQDLLDLYDATLRRAKPFLEFHLASDMPDRIDDDPADILATIEALTGDTRPQLAGDDA